MVIKCQGNFQFLAFASLALKMITILKTDTRFSLKNLLLRLLLKFEN
jgi:hypothetical protein